MLLLLAWPACTFAPCLARPVLYLLAWSYSRPGLMPRCRLQWPKGTQTARSGGGKELTSQAYAAANGPMTCGPACKCAWVARAFLCRCRWPSARAMRCACRIFRRRQSLGHRGDPPRCRCGALIGARSWACVCVRVPANLRAWVCACVPACVFVLVCGRCSPGCFKASSGTARTWRCVD